MVVTVRRVDVWSALKVGLVLSPILYTVYGFILTQGAGIGLSDYLGNLARSILYGAAFAALAAWSYNAVARRVGPLKFQLEVVHESQETT